MSWLERKPTSQFLIKDDAVFYEAQHKYLKWPNLCRKDEHNDSEADERNITIFPGTPVSGGVVRGTARVVLTIDEANEIKVSPNASASNAKHSQRHKGGGGGRQKL